MIDLGNIKGQEPAKRALEIAALGRHSVLLYGPMGCGKTSLASALTGLLGSVTICDDIDEAAGDALYRLNDGQMIVATATDAAALPAKLMDRFPIVVEMHRLTPADMILPAPTEETATVLGRLDQAGKRPVPGHLEQNAIGFLREVAERMPLTVRGFDHAMAVGKTIARLDGKASVARIHIAEALGYIAQGTQPARSARAELADRIVAAVERLAETIQSGGDATAARAGLRSMVTQGTLF